MAGPLEFFGDVIGGAGKFIGGVGEHLGTGLKAVRDAERAEMALPRLRQQAIEANEQFAILKGDFSPEEKENAARKIIQAIQPKLYEQRLRQDPNAKFYQPILSREEQKKKALDPYGRQYGGGGVDPYVRGVEDIGKIQAAREKFVFDKIKPETAAYFDLADQSVKDRMRGVIDKTRRRGDGLGSLPKADRGSDFVGPPSPFRKVEPELPTSKSAAKYFQGVDQVDPIDRAIKAAGGRKSLPKADKVDRRDFFAPRGELDVFEEMGAPSEKPRIADYFQASTDTVPESNIPKTYQQLGVTNVDDMFILDEMQKALPDVDLRKEYENDPESIQRLMQLWKARKINKSNLHKFFSAIQQKARQALGIA